MATRLERLLSLRRYLATASVARTAMHDYQRRNPGMYGHGDPDDVEFFTRMSLWYSLLYVVLEGWNSVCTDDDQPVDISRKAKQALKDFRDKTFHAQPKFPPKELTHYVERSDSVSLAYKLNAQLRYVIEDAIKREQAEAAGSN